VKIIHFTWSAQFGGISKIVIDLINWQNENGFRSELLLGKSSGELLSQEHLKKISFHEAKLKSGTHVSIQIISKIIKLFSQFDIIHIHDFNPLIAYCATRSKTPIIYTEHGNLGLERNLRFFEKINLKFQSIFINSYVESITYNSVFTKTEAHRILHLKPKHETIIANGVLAPRSISQGNLNGIFIIGAYGRLVSFKRFDRVIKALSLMTNKNSCKLIIAGDGPLLSTLQSQTEKLGITSLVQFTGYDPNIERLQQSVNIHVVPSRSEPFGIVALECLATGKPVLVFQDGGGLIEILNGIATENICLDTNDLARKLDYFFENRNDINKNSDSQRAYLNNFTINKMASKFSSIYLNSIRSSG